MDDPVSLEARHGAANYAPLPVVLIAPQITSRWRRPSVSTQP